jgi:hypothetical protein
MRRSALLVTGLLVLAAVGAAQVPPSPGGPPVPALPPGEKTFGPSADPVAPPHSLPLDPAATRIPSPNVPPAAAPPRPAEPTVEQMIEALERLKAQKADLDRQEQAIKEALAKKLAAQGERLRKLGVGEKADEPKRAPRTSQPTKYEDGPPPGPNTAPPLPPPEPSRRPSSDPAGGPSTTLPKPPPSKDLNRDLSAWLRGQ